MKDHSEEIVRDYSLDGVSTAFADSRGLSRAEWYRTQVSRKDLKALMKRRDGPALRDTILWFAMLGLSATGGILTWESPWTIPLWLIYGVLYGSVCDSRWHECGHGTAFRSQWMNDVVYQIASFMVVRNPVTWRWSHARHHSDTIIVGRDPEIACKRPPNLYRLLLAYGGIVEMFDGMRALFRNALGYMSADEKAFTPESEWPRLIRAARIHVAIYAATGAVAIMFTSWIPVMLIGLPRLYGCWHMVLTGLLQHCGLAENVLDHRLNSRTVLINPVSRWIYWNMNYHVEHHMFPMVPFHALPQLHELIKHDLPAPNTSFLDAYREAIPAVMRQAREPDFYLRKPLPATAQPYLEDTAHV